MLIAIYYVPFAPLGLLEAGAHRISIALAIHSLDCTLRAAIGRDSEIAPTGVGIRCAL